MIGESKNRYQVHTGWPINGKNVSETQLYVDFSDRLTF